MAKVYSSRSTVHLLKDEAGGLMMETGITTITFYKGTFNAASAALRAQFAEVVKANPWLAGRLIKSRSGTQLQFPAEGVSEGLVSAMFASHAFQEGANAKDGALFLPAPERGYEAICTEMYRSGTIIVESGSALLGKDKPVALLTLAESKAGEFALVFSLSHSVGDGRTYYEVLKMLAPGSAVRKLPAARVQAFSEAMRGACGREALAWVESPAAMVHFLPLMLGCGSKARCYAFDLDPSRVAAAKAEGAMEEGVEYVTTNDVLTSSFFNACNSRIGLMGLDCRGRLPGIAEDMAGNYVTALVLDDAVFETPGSLRKMYGSQPYQTTGRPLPGCCCAGKVSFAMVSNWASFAGGLVPFKGCEMVVHLPVKNPAYIMWDEMVPFASGAAGKMGVLCWTVSTDEAGLRAALPVGACISNTLFP